MIRWKIGSWVPIIATGSSVEVLRGPHGPRIILLGLRWSLRVFQGCQEQRIFYFVNESAVQDNYDLSECHYLCDLGRHKDPFY